MYRYRVYKYMICSRNLHKGWCLTEGVPIGFKKIKPALTVSTNYITTICFFHSSLLGYTTGPFSLKKQFRHSLSYQKFETYIYIDYRYVYIHTKTHLNVPEIKASCYPEHPSTSKEQGGEKSRSTLGVFSRTPLGPYLLNQGWSNLNQPWTNGRLGCSDPGKKLCHLCAAEFWRGGCVTWLSSWESWEING